MATFLLDPVSCRYLCFEEREEIALLRAEGKGVREIARRVGRSALATHGRESGEHLGFLADGETHVVGQGWE